MGDLELFVLLGLGGVLVFYAFLFFVRWLWGSNWKKEINNF